jgi:hypothetical protein
MKYLLLLSRNPSQAPHYSREERPAAQQTWFDLLKEMKAANVYLSNYGLAPVISATTVRVRNGETQTTQVPLAATDEQLGGYFMLDCETLDEAIGWAAKIPYAQHGSIEIRPVVAYT